MVGTIGAERRHLDAGLQVHATMVVKDGVGGEAGGGGVVGGHRTAGAAPATVVEMAAKPEEARRVLSAGSSHGGLSCAGPRTEATEVGRVVHNADEVTTALVVGGPDAVGRAAILLGPVEVGDREPGSCGAEQEESAFESAPAQQQPQQQQ